LSKQRNIELSDRHVTTQDDYTLKSDSPFFYQCKACQRCCHHKAIRVTPYEILRLARGLGLSTTEFIAAHTQSGGTVLRTQKSNDGACIFLSKSGCSVYADRPLVCRIYPLGSWEMPDGEQTFRRLEPAPKSEGIFGTDGTIADFLISQGLEPAYAMDARYHEVFDRMSDCLDSLDSEELDKWNKRQRTLEKGHDGIAASPWIDIDLSVSNYCKSHGREVPDDLADMVTLHIAAIDEWINSLSG
jgi:uncharacterized protein